MITQEEMILLESDFEPFQVNGVIVKPFYNNGSWLLPIGFENELELRNIAYKVQTVDFISDEDDGGYEEIPEPIITKIIDNIDDDLI